MTYKEAKDLYDTAKDEKALKALIEFFEYHNNNKNVLYYIADCFNELQRFFDGLNYVVSKVDNNIFPFERYSATAGHSLKAESEICLESSGWQKTKAPGTGALVS